MVDSDNQIIDNRREELKARIGSILESSERAKFAVGYFYISGLESVAKQLAGVSELRLLIGSSSNRETIEQMAEGYRRLELVRERLEEQQYQKKSQQQEEMRQTVMQVGQTLAELEQSDACEETVRTLAEMIAGGRLKIRVYTKGVLHSKAYIFDFKNANPHAPGIAIVGSSNFTISGLRSNTELNVVVEGKENHRELTQWFEDLWDEAQDFDASLMQELRASWPLAQVRPWDIYMKTLYTLVKDRLESEETGDILWEDEITSRLTDFQRDAVRQAVQIIRQHGGGFVSDVVGLGKSFVGTAIIKHFERTEQSRALIICPAPLLEMWERYSEEYDLRARVLSLGKLVESDDQSNFLLNDELYRDRDFVLVDESHNFRNTGTQRYKLLENYLTTPTETGKRRKCVLLTATPRNKSVWDIYNQIKLYQADDKTDLPIDPPHLRQYFQLIERNERRLPDLLSNILIRRTRNYILRIYGYDEQSGKRVDSTQFEPYLNGEKRAYVLVGGQHQYFPRRELETIEYSIEATYQGLYQELRHYLGKPGQGQPNNPPPGELSFARYGLWRYVRPGKQKQEPYASLQRAGSNLRGLIRIMLFKRFESSVYAFRETVSRLLRVHESFLLALYNDTVPAGEAAQKILSETEYGNELEMLLELDEVTGRYNPEDLDMPRLRKHIQQDIDILKSILGLVEQITAEQDAKLQALKQKLAEPALKTGKCLIFTQYADTASYLYENLNGPHDPTIAQVRSDGKNKAQIAARFAPLANPGYPRPANLPEIRLLIATDVFSEGLNLQDCDKIINYDLHWNPVRLIQRFGRIDRIGGQHARIYGYNFLPELGIERNLGLRQKLHNRIQEIHDTIGEDSAILDRTEELNAEAMYAIYEQKSGQLSMFEEEDNPAGSTVLDLNEAEAILRQLREDDPAEYERIASLRDGIRTGRQTGQRGIIALCQAGNYRQLYLADAEGKALSQETTLILGRLKCEKDDPAVALPPAYNTSITHLHQEFARLVQRRQAEKDYTQSFTQGQRYVLSELRMLYGQTEEEELRLQITRLDKAFRQPLNMAANRDLTLLRRNQLKGQSLFRNLIDLYHRHNLQEERRTRPDPKQDNHPRIICSLALI